MARDCDADTCLGVTGFIAVAVGVVLCFIFSIIVVVSYDRTKGFDPVICDGQTGHLDIDAHGYYTTGTLQAWIVNSTDPPFHRIREVELIDPPLPGAQWLIKSDRNDINSWAGALKNPGSTFECLIENPNDPDTSKIPIGISSEFDDIVGWGFMLAISSIILLAAIFAMFYLCCCDK
jgi:hypothetical protein